MMQTGSRRAVALLKKPDRRRHIDPLARRCRQMRARPELFDTPADHRRQRRLRHRVRRRMHREHRHSPSIGKQHRAQMSDRRRTINLGPRHNMPSAPLPSLRRPAGEKNRRTARCCSLARKLRVLERDVAYSRDLVNAADQRPARRRVPRSSDRYACNCFKLMTKDGQRDPLERFRLRPVDKREYLFINGHRIKRQSTAERSRSWHRAARPFNPARPEKHLFTLQIAVFTSLLKCSTLRPVDGWRGCLGGGHEDRASGAFGRLQRYYLSFAVLITLNSGRNDFATDTYFC